MADFMEELSAIPAFANISKESLSYLTKLLKEETYTEGQHIVHEGDSADAVYILRSGEVEIRKVINREAGKYKMLAILDEGDIFGEMAVFGEEFRSADVVARRDSRAWKLDYSELFNLLNREPASGVKILQVIMTIIVARLKSINNELITLYELGRLLPRLNDIESLSKVVFDLVMNVISSAETGFIAILNIYNEEFDVYQSTGALKTDHIDYSNPLAVWMFENKAPILVRDTFSDQRFRNIPFLGQSFIASPFLYEDNLLGFILMSNSSRKYAFNYNQMILISTVCSQVGEKINDIERKKEETLRRRLNQGKLSVNR